jgi:Cu/Ag efflux pump CusA
LLKTKGVTLYDRLHRPATFIETALANVQNSLLVGGALVGIVLLLFLAVWRRQPLPTPVVPETSVPAAPQAQLEQTPIEAEKQTVAPGSSPEQTG